jgi:hypothetical protein
VRTSDPWGAAQRTAADAQPPVKFCIVCDAEFSRLYTTASGRPRLRSLPEWRRSLYCSRECASRYRRNKPRAGRPTLPLHIAALG